MKSYKGKDASYSVTVFDKEYKNMVDLAESFDIDYTKLCTRLRDGRSLEIAVESLLDEKAIVFNGKTYQSTMELCLEYKIPLQILNNRLNLEWSLEKALTTPIRNRDTNEKYEYRGNVYTSKRKLAEAEGFYLSYIITVQKRTGLAFIEALDMVVQFTKQYKGDRPELISNLPYVIYNGKWFNTLRSFCEEVGANSAHLTKFMSRHKVVTHFKALEMMREKPKKYPDCTFKITGYCATPNLDFDNYLKERFG